MSICNKQHLSNICNINCSIIYNIQNEEETPDKWVYIVRVAYL